MCLSKLEIGAEQLLSAKSILVCQQKPYLVTTCDLMCLRVSEEFWLLSVSMLSVKILTQKKKRKKGKTKTLKKTLNAEILANNK